jgi:hypothetical protein
MKFEEAMEAANLELVKSLFNIQEKGPNNFADDFVQIEKNGEVIEEPGKTFDQVFEDFKNGKNIRRKVWNKEYNLHKHYQLIKDENYNLKLPIFSSDLIEDDWEVVGE